MRSLLVLCYLSLLFYYPHRTVAFQHVNHAKSSAVAVHEGSTKRGPIIPKTTVATYSVLYAKTSSARSSLSEQFRRRLSADPSFVTKSITEVTLAATTQLIAEVGRRGKHHILLEIDFVIAGILTAVAGKYYSMWRVAPTSTVSSETNNKDRHSRRPSTATTFWDKVPTNAFQDTCLDGSKPTLLLRLASFIAPMPSLFQAGVFSSALGYGSTAIFIALRSMMMPSYVSQTQKVNVLAACVYTGSFMAIVSNVRYQLLSGIIEPKILHRWLKQYPVLHACMVFTVRLGNGILGSILAITGMTWCGLQKLKS